MEANVIDGLVAQLQLTNGFEQGNSGTAVAYDHRVLATGVDRAAVVLPGAFQQQRMVMGGLAEMTYALELYLCVRDNNDTPQAERDLATYTGNIVTRLNMNPTLGGSAYDSLVTSGQVDPDKLTIGKVPFLSRRIVVTAIEHLAIG